MNKENYEIMEKYYKELLALYDESSERRKEMIFDEMRAVFKWLNKNKMDTY